MQCWTSKGKHSQGIIYPYYSVPPLVKEAYSLRFLQVPKFGSGFSNWISGDKYCLSLVFQSVAIISTDVKLATPVQVLFQNILLQYSVPAQWLQMTDGCLISADSNS